MIDERLYMDRPPSESGVQTRSRRHTAPVPIFAVTESSSTRTRDESGEHPGNNTAEEQFTQVEDQAAHCPVDTFHVVCSSAGFSSTGQYFPNVMHESMGTPTQPTGELEGLSGGDGGGGVRSAKRKRSRVTPAQLAQLERAFAKDRSPTAAKRKEISELLGMQERQTQVWFQNRRAKAKLLEQRARAARFGGHHQLDHSSPSRSSSNATLSETELRAMLHEDDPIYVVPCTDLSIGTFRRISAAHYDLLGYTCENRRTFSWYIYSAGTGFKMDIPYESIGATEYTDDALPGQGRIVFHLTQTPTFFRESAASPESSPPSVRAWQPCEDWTEGQQATSCLRHEVVGGASELEQALSLIHVDPFSPMYTATNQSSSSFASSGPSSSRHSPVNSISTPSLPQVGPGPSSFAPPSSYVDPFGPRGSHISHGRRRSRSNPTPYEPRRHSISSRTPVSAGGSLGGSTQLFRRSTFAEHQRGPRTDRQILPELDIVPFPLNPSSTDSLYDPALGDASTVPIARPIPRHYTSPTVASGHFTYGLETSSSIAPHASDIPRPVNASHIGHYHNDSPQISHITQEEPHSSSPSPHPSSQAHAGLPYQLPPDPALTQYGLHSTLDMGSMEDVDFDVLTSLDTLPPQVVVSPEVAVAGTGLTDGSMALDYIPPENCTGPSADQLSSMPQGDYHRYFTSDPSAR